MAKKPPTIKTKTWGGTELERTKPQLDARFKNVQRENFPSVSQYKNDAMQAAFKKDIRANPGSRVKKSPPPVGKGGR